MENAVKLPKVQNNGWNTMLNEEKDIILTTKEACYYLRISRPTYLKYLQTGRIKATRVGKSWRVLKSELDWFLQGDNRNMSFVNATTEDYTGNPI